MTYFKEAGTGGPLAHTGVLPGHCCYLWVCSTISNSISCHSSYKAKDRCYDYLHSPTLPHLKAPSSNLKRRVFTHYCHLPQPMDFLAKGQHLFHHFCGSCPSSWLERNTDNMTIRHTHTWQKSFYTIILYKLYCILLLTCWFQLAAPIYKKKNINKRNKTSILPSHILPSHWQNFQKNKYNNYCPCAPHQITH